LGADGRSQCQYSHPTTSLYASYVWQLWGGAIASTSLTFISQAALDAGIPAALGLKTTTVAVRNTRQLSKADMKLNDATPEMEVNPETYEVRADGELLTCEPAQSLPMTQRYFLF
jgi:urease subunit alpha